MAKHLFFGLFVSFLAFAALPASAASVSEQIELCVAAVDAEDLATVSDYRVKFVRSSGGAAKKVSIDLIPFADGEVLRAECKIRRGEVQEVALKA